MSSKNPQIRYQELAKKWLDQTITPAEMEEFAEWYNADQQAAVNIPPDFADNEKILKLRIFNRITTVINSEPVLTKRKNAGWLAIAASILLLAAFFTLFYRNSTNGNNHLITKRRKDLPVKNDILPGGNKAVLTLSNGRTINLNDVKNGVLANQGKAVLKKSKDGQVIYETDEGKKASDGSTLYNTITIPKGGEFQAVLSDGTKVWLNSASSITFPAAFSTTERKVTVTGEVYFEVAHNKNLPFRVIAGKQTIEVLGTHFNINAYEDENTIKTTLIEGSVKVMADALSTMLKPEQQSTVARNKSEPIAVRSVDTEDVLAWKNGNFQFEKAEIPLIMREAARWYDVDVKYEGKVPQRKFTGSISRSVNLSELLKMLKYTGLNFKIEGKTIIVTS